MGRSGYTSLSLEEKRYARLRRNFDSTIKTEDTFTVWATSVMENSISRIKYLSKTYPHLKIIKIIPNGIVIEDTKKNDIVKITTNDLTKINEYTIFSMIHPEFNYG